MRSNSTRKSLKAHCDRLFSEFIRKRDTPGRCCTCKTWILYHISDAGHFISRNHESTRYDEKNVHAQCRKCNRFSSGKQYEFGLFIDQKYGEGTAEKILIMSKMKSFRTITDYNFLVTELKSKLVKQ